MISIVHGSVSVTPGNGHKWKEVACLKREPRVTIWEKKITAGAGHSIVLTVPGGKLEEKDEQERRKLIIGIELP